MMRLGKRIPSRKLEMFRVGKREHHSDIDYLDDSEFGDQLDSETYRETLEELLNRLRLEISEDLKSIESSEEHSHHEVNSYSPLWKHHH